MVQFMSFQRKARLQLSSKDFVWAYHCDVAEALAQLCFPMKRDWPSLGRFGVVYRMRSHAQLRDVAKQLAKAQFLRQKNPMDSILLYLVSAQLWLSFFRFRLSGL